jgi:hypothetical protein
MIAGIAVDFLYAQKACVSAFKRYEAFVPEKDNLDIVRVPPLKVYPL